ncbi:MAG: hypothetical protein IJH04_02320 [Eggerthellaceae bacterium]|nr:hypothetical protein [Eggerthellaceae bacterium]
MVFQEDNVRVTFTNMERASFRFSLEESEAFDYGNGTCVKVKQEGCWPETIDTRYDERVSKSMSAEEFAEWVSEWLRERFQVFMVERTVRV